MTHLQQPIAVIGATGQQGGSVVDALLAQNQAVRDAQAAGARALRARGVEVVAADQENSESLQRALTEVAALFFMATFEGAAGTDCRRRLDAGLVGRGRGRPDVRKRSAAIADAVDPDARIRRSRLLG